MSGDVSTGPKSHLMTWFRDKDIWTRLRLLRLTLSAMKTPMHRRPLYCLDNVARCCIFVDVTMTGKSTTNANIIWQMVSKIGKVKPYMPKAHLFIMFSDEFSDKYRRIKTIYSSNCPHLARPPSVGLFGLSKGLRMLPWRTARCYDFRLEIISYRFMSITRAPVASHPGDRLLWT